MSASSKIWTAGIVGALVGALVGGGVAYRATSTQVSTLQAQLVVSNAARLAADQKAARSDQAAANALKAAAEANAKANQTGSTTSATTTTTAKPTTPKAVRQYAFVTKIAKSGSAYTLTADYAEFLTGKPAAAAAKARGDESPPPNDYYIVNDNKLLRKLPVKSGATVRLTDKGDGTSDPNGYSATMAEWRALFTSADSGPRFKNVGYWLTITNGAVTHVEEQWVP